MKSRLRIFALALAALLVVAASPYRDMTERQIRSLSPERIEGLRNGAGIGYALPAELNGYAGPRHVLDLAERLDLSDEQRQAAQGLFDRMKAEVVPLGEALIGREAALDALFRNGKATEEALFRLTSEAATVEAKLRATHLKYHIRMAALLSPHQRLTYHRLRGYERGRSHGGHGH